MGVLKFLIVFFCTISFLGSSVLSKSLSICAVEMNNVKNESELEKSNCHSHSEQKKKILSCLECECNFTQVLLNSSSKYSVTYNVKSIYNSFMEFHYSINIKKKDPPPKISS